MRYWACSLYILTCVISSVFYYLFSPPLSIDSVFVLVSLRGGKSPIFFMFACPCAFVSLFSIPLCIFGFETFLTRLHFFLSLLHHNDVDIIATPPDFLIFLFRSHSVFIFWFLVKFEDGLVVSFITLSPSVVDFRVDVADENQDNLGVFQTFFGGCIDVRRGWTEQFMTEGVGEPWISISTCSSAPSEVTFSAWCS